ncbi:UDP-glycosyltransferase 90A1 [Hibiscus syriacus]|uniref:UDP-glycosyltransferase 90A1 n=1 Tax=Hibiscus syriacus TaxID=106335 RepID=A0A6A3A9H8_HIBSY|nr:UDP-glycosyltransferase 90A1 [Hibiscus syriacus]
MQLGGQTLEGLFQVFDSYVNMLIKGLPVSIDEETDFRGTGNKIVRMAETEAQQIALLANASLLAGELLPRAAMKLSPSQASYKEDHRRRTSDRQNCHPEQREWKRRLLSSVERLKNTFCQQHALNLIFTEEGDSHLTAEMYINMDGSADEVEWFPSPIFQLYLDRKFVICFASQGRYLSRNLHRVVNEIIVKAMAAFAATGMDPYSLLPDDGWFNDICQDAIERLSGKPKADRDLNSPTASVSAQSISSVRSYGSSLVAFYFTLVYLIANTFEQ